jgi:hypothetical protein
MMPSRRRFLKTTAALLSGNAVMAQAPAIPSAGTSPEDLMQTMLDGFRLTQMVHAAAKSGIAEQLRDGPRAVEQLAAATGTHADSLYRLLRALAGFGIFEEQPGMRFRLTPAAELLLPGVPGSVRASALQMGQPDMWRSWGALTHSVKTGENAFEHLYGMNDFEWYKEHPAEARLFDEFQAEMTRRWANAVVGAYDFTAARRVVDVGGGAGELLFTVLRRAPNARGVLFDLDHVVNAARSKVEPVIARRCDFVGGDFFKAVPTGGDIYVMKYIIHDWDDRRARQILGKCHEAMAGKGKLLLVEELVCGPNQRCRAKMSDITMLVRTGGRNRTEQEYRDLLADGGFKLERVLPAGGLYVMESSPGRSIPLELPAASRP